MVDAEGVVGAVPDHVRDALGVLPEDVVSLPLGQLVEGGGTDTDGAAVHGLGGGGEVVGVDKEEERNGSGMLKVAPTRLVDEAAGSVLDVGGGGGVRDEGAHEGVGRGFVGLERVDIAF